MFKKILKMKNNGLEFYIKVITIIKGYLKIQKKSICKIIMICKRLKIYCNNRIIS